jgi:phosphoglycolate phosphatase
LTPGGQPFRALIFDLDGTLIDSAPDVCAAVNRSLASHGRRAITLPEAKALIGQGGRVLAERSLALTGRPGTPGEIESLLKAFLATYAERPVEHTVVYPRAREALQFFRAEGVRLAVCTNKPKATTVPVMAALDLDGLFDVVSCGDQVPYRKPDARHVLGVVEQLGATPATTALIGDSENDIAAARAAGVPSIAVTFGYAHVPHAELGADALIDNFEELSEALRSIAAKRKIA